MSSCFLILWKFYIFYFFILGISPSKISNMWGMPYYWKFYGGAELARLPPLHWSCRLRQTFSKLYGCIFQLICFCGQIITFWFNWLLFSNVIRGQNTVYCYLCSAIHGFLWVFSGRGAGLQVRPSSFGGARVCSSPNSGRVGRGNPNAQISSANTVNISMYTLIFDVLLHFKQESF